MTLSPRPRVFLVPFRFLRTHVWHIGVGLAIFLAGYFLVGRSAEVVSALSALRGAELKWAVLALCGQVALLLTIAMQYKLILRRLGHAVPFRTLLRCQLWRALVGSVVPFGGAPSIAIFVRDMDAIGVPRGDALFATLLRGLTGKIVFLVTAVPVAATILPRLVPAGETLRLMSWLGIAALTILTAGLVIPLTRRTMLGCSASLRMRLSAQASSIRDHRLGPRDLVLPLMLAAAMNAIGIFSLYASLQAMHATASIGSLLLGRTTATVAAAATPVFHGEGVVEVALASSFHHAGVPIAAALAAAMIYRIGHFWLPLLGGLLVVPTRAPGVVTGRVRSVQGLAMAAGVLLLFFSGLASPHLLELMRQADIG